MVATVFDTRDGKGPSPTKYPYSLFVYLCVQVVVFVG